jgi:hypothetical protein
VAIQSKAEKIKPQFAEMVPSLGRLLLRCEANTRYWPSHEEIFIGGGRFGFSWDLSIDGENELEQSPAACGTLHSTWHVSQCGPQN